MLKKLILIIGLISIITISTAMSGCCCCCCSGGGSGYDDYYDDGHYYSTEDSINNNNNGKTAEPKVNVIEYNGKKYI